MKFKLTQIAACTAAALGVALSGAAFAGGDKAKTTAGTNNSNAAQSPTTQSDTATANQSSTSVEARLKGIQGQTVKDASGNVLGTVQSFTADGGQVTATVVNSSGATQQVPLGTSETVAGQISQSGTSGLMAAPGGAAGATTGSTNGSMSGSGSTTGSTTMGTTGSTTMGTTGSSTNGSSTNGTSTDGSSTAAANSTAKKPKAKASTPGTKPDKTAASSQPGTLQ